MGVTDAEGKVRQAVGGLLVGQSVQQRPWFRAGLDGEYTGDPHEAVLLAKMLPGLPNGEPLRFIDFAAPIHNADGQVIGVLGAHAHWSWVTRMVESAAFAHKHSAPDIEALIIDHDGKVLYPEALAGQQVATADEELQGWTASNGFLTSTVSVPTPSSTALTWSIAVRQPLQTALQPARLLFYKLLILGVFAALVFGLVAYYLALYLSRPIEQLAHSARQVQNKQTGVQFALQHPVQEIAQLGQSIEAMTQSLLAKERELQQANASLEATHDALTGVYNRRRFDEKLTEYTLLFRRTGRPFSLLLIDADHFKRINDTHGHAVGDAVLQQLAQLIQASVRTTDFIARYGGEEFAVLLPEIATPDTPEVVAEKIRAAIASADFPGIEQVTVSIGIGLADPADNSHAALLKRADQQLYQAKANGRNRVA
jgi:diguanylate cyclase (GGDEF)-like protein